MLRLGIGAVATALAAFALVPAAHALSRPLVPRGTELRVVILPVKLKGERVPSERQLRRLVRDLAAWYDRATYGRLRVTGDVAPAIAAGSFEIAPRSLDARIQRVAIQRASARGVRTAGAIPVFIEASRTPSPSFGSPGAVQIRGGAWRETDAVAHELGHALGLDHAHAPTVCRRPFRPLACADHPRNDFEYGDTLDVMGFGGDRFGAYSLAALALAPVRDARPGRSVTALRPLDGPRPTLLRLRTAARDWFVETRRRTRLRNEPTTTSMPRGVSISRAIARYEPIGEAFPRPQRIPATDPERRCRAGSAACLARQVFGPGRRFTVPGAFRLRVLGRRGRVRVETTWHDRTPPSVAVTSARVVRPFGGAPQLALDLRAQATGAGVTRVDVDQGGRVTRVDADAVDGLVRGHGTVRAPLAAASTARVRLIDAAGNASAWVGVDLASVPGSPAAGIAWNPPLGVAAASATPLAPGRSVTVSGITDPALAGIGFVRFEAIGDHGTPADLPIAPDGSFSTTWTAPASGLYLLRVRVPVESEAGGLAFRTQVVEGHVRG